MNNPGEMYEALEHANRVLQGALLNDVQWSITHTLTRTDLELQEGAMICGCLNLFETHDVDALGMSPLVYR